MNRWELTIGAPSDNGEHHAFDIMGGLPWCGEKRFHFRGTLKIHRVTVLRTDDNEAEFGKIFVGWTQSGPHVAIFNAAGSQNMDFNETSPEEGFPMRFVVQQGSGIGIPISSIIVRLEGELDGTLTPL